MSLKGSIEKLSGVGVMRNKRRYHQHVGTTLVGGVSSFIQGNYNFAIPCVGSLRVRILRAWVHTFITTTAGKYIVDFNGKLTVTGGTAINTENSPAVTPPPLVWWTSNNGVPPELMALDLQADPILATVAMNLNFQLVPNTAFAVSDNVETLIVIEYEYLD